MPEDSVQPQRSGDGSDEALRAVDDAARDAVVTALGLVDVAAWRFGRIDGTKHLRSFACALRDEPVAERSRQFLAQYRVLQQHRNGGLALVADDRFPYAVAVRLDVGGAEPAMLVLLRTETDGPFSEGDVARLLFAVVRQEQAGRDEAQIRSMHAAERREPGLAYVLDAEYRIVLGSAVHLPAHVAGLGRSPRLSKHLEQAVRRAVNAHCRSRGSRGLTFAILPRVALTVQRVEGDDGPRAMVLLDRARRRNVLRAASDRFFITPRERDVLSHLLEGKRVEEIAQDLKIAPSTVTDHIKRLIGRTDAANRSQMLARLLGWEPSTDPDD